MVQKIDAFHRFHHNHGYTKQDDKQEHEVKQPTRSRICSIYRYIDFLSDDFVFTLQLSHCVVGAKGLTYNLFSYKDNQLAIRSNYYWQEQAQ